MNEIIRLRTEPCSICNKTLALGVKASELKPDITGLDLYLDLHGLDGDSPHARLLYIDGKGFVRTITMITKFTDILHKD